MPIREQLDTIAKNRILIMDGAMGSMIQTLNLDENDFRGSAFAAHPTPLKGCNDLLCITKPEVISAIHNAYLEVGADIIETCSFNATAITLSDYGIGGKAYEISAAAAGIARKSADAFSTADKPRFVAGSMGPTGKSASLYPDINDPSKRSIRWDELEAAYYDNARGLLDGGADILLVETIFDTLNAKAALFAISRLMEERRVNVPVMISVSVAGESGRLLAGQTLDAFCVSVLHAKPWSIGVNCSLSAEKLLPSARLLSATAGCLVSACPNAGLPDKSGQYQETPERMADYMAAYMEEGLVSIVGGCCGSTPAHIAAIAEKAKKYQPRNLPPSTQTQTDRLSGLEPLVVTDVATVTSDTGLDELIAAGEYEDAADTARDIIEGGAAIINIETENEKALDHFLDFALLDPYVAKAPFMLSSSRWTVIETGLKRLQGRSLVNLKDTDELSRKTELIRYYGAAIYKGALL